MFESEVQYSVLEKPSDHIRHQRSRVNMFGALKTKRLGYIQRQSSRSDESAMTRRCQKPVIQTWACVSVGNIKIRIKKGIEEFCTARETRHSFMNYGPRK